MYIHSEGYYMRNTDSHFLMASFYDPIPDFERDYYYCYLVL